MISGSAGSHGYDTVDHWHVGTRLGGDEAFERLVRAARARELPIMLDGVVNHVGAEFAGLDGERAGWLRRDPHGRVRTCEGHAGLLALDHDNPAVADHVAAVMTHWLDAGADALTLAGTPAIYYGDELGLTGRKEDRVGGDDAVRPASPAPGPLPDGSAELLHVHRQLVGVRRRHPWVHTARTESVTLTDTTLVLRLTGDDTLTLALSLADEALELTAPGSVLAGTADALGDGSWRLPGHGWAVVG